MKRLMTTIALLLLATVLVACTPDEDESTRWVVLPDLKGLTRPDVIDQLEPLDIPYTFVYLEEDPEKSLLFDSYEGHEAGDIVDAAEVVVINIYPQYSPYDYVELPDLAGLTRADIAASLAALQISFYFAYEETEDPLLEDFFISYVDDLRAGDEVLNSSAVGVLIYSYEVVIGEEYFQVIDMPYDGPYLDESYAVIDYMDPRGGYFEVTLSSCTDGDTARFGYPQDIFDAIQSGAKSTRFLNMDTEETYNGGEEEWGKPGSIYTCSLLEGAESIVLQTDPGDGLLDTYGRLLAWIWIQLPGEEEYFLLNYMVVKQGLAQVKYEFGAGLDLSYGEHTYNEWMHIAEDYAIDNELGQWGNLLDYYWNYETDEPYYDRWYAN